MEAPQAIPQTDTSNIVNIQTDFNLMIPPKNNFRLRYIKHHRFRSQLFLVPEHIRPGYQPGDQSLRIIDIAKVGRTP